MTARVPRHDGFNKMQIKDGWIVLMNKDGRIRQRIEPVGSKKNKKKK